MQWTFEVIVFWLLLIDAIAANIIAWPGNAWYSEHFRLMSRWLPITKAWALFYLILVLWLGYIMHSLGAF